MYKEWDETCVEGKTYQLRTLSVKIQQLGRSCLRCTQRIHRLRFRHK